MKKYFIALSVLICFTNAYAQSPGVFTDCENDTKFFMIVTSRPMPRIACDTVYLITKQHQLRLSVLEKQNSAINTSLKKEIELYKQQNLNYQQLAERHKKHADSLDTFLLEKDKQLTEMTALAKRATENTDRALKVAKTNRALAIGGGVLSGVLLVLLIAK